MLYKPVIESIAYDEPTSSALARIVKEHGEYGCHISGMETVLAYVPDPEATADAKLGKAVRGLPDMHSLHHVGDRWVIVDHSIYKPGVDMAIGRGDTPEEAIAGALPRPDSDETREAERA